MLDFLTVVFDPYDRKARIQPALLSVVPVFVACLLLIPQLGAMWTTVGGVILYCGSTMLLAQLGRDRGKKLEPMLFDAWGGKPSVAMLRHRDTRLAKHTKDRYRAFLTANIPGLELASPEVEQQSPTLADDAYGSATSWSRRRYEVHQLRATGSAPGRRRCVQRSSISARRIGMGLG